MGEVHLQPVGVVRNSITDKEHHGWKGICSDIFVKEEYIPALEGLADFSHIIVLFWLHKVTPEDRATKRARPTRKAGIPELGIFAWHSSHRPNPIGMSVVQLLEVQGDRVRVQGLDAIDGTPVLDMHPYVESYYHAGNPIEPGWVAMTRM
ncbi:MAG: universally conserved protein [Dehalococcoidia bacterium]|nr:universally conserved protein [Dehalococcoidia bacterium]